MFKCIQRTGLSSLEQMKQAIKEYPNAFSDGISFFAPTKMFTENFENAFQDFINAYSQLSGMGISVHANICCIGHSDTGVGGEPIKCETMVDSKGKGCLCSACPRGEKFKKIIGETVEEYAKLHVPVIWLDDDFRLSFHSPVDYGCFCDKCIAKFNSENNLNLTREQLRNAILKDQIVDGKKIRLLWQDFNRKGMADLAKSVSDAVHKIDDSIIIGYMQINPEMVPYEIQHYGEIIKVSQNKNGEVWFRHGSGFYSDQIPQEMIEKNISIARLCSLSKSKEYKVVNLTEEVTLPYNRRAKSMANTILDCVLNVAFAGADGVMDEAIHTNTEEQLKKGNIVSTMHDYHSYLSRVKELVKDKKQIGVYPYFSPNLWSYNDQVDEINEMKDLGASIWLQLFYAGVPITFDEESAIVLLLSGKTVRAMEDDKLKAWLSRGIYADGSSALEINKRIPNMTGVEAFDTKTIGLANRGTGEFFTDHPLNGKSQNYIRINLAQMIGLGNAKLKLAGASALSFSDNEQERAVGLLGSSVYENSLGGKVAISSRGAWDQDILNSAKTEQIKNVIDYLADGKIPVRLENTCRMGMTIWENEKEKVVFLFNTDYDADDSVKLILDGEYKAQYLSEDLSIKDIGNGKEIKVPTINPWKTGIVILKK